MSATFRFPLAAALAAALSLPAAGAAQAPTPTPTPTGTTPAPAAPAAPADVVPAGPAGGPSCGEIQGDWLGQTGRWRIMRVGESLDAEPLIACRRDLPGPAAVRVLGMSKGYDDGGEDSETPSGGPYVSLDAFGDGRAVLTTRTFDAARPGSRSTGGTTLVDLDRGTSVVLPGELLDDSEADPAKEHYHYVESVMTPRGGVAWAYVQRDGKGPYRAGPWTLWDAAGSRAVPVGGGIDDVAVSIGAGGDTGGVYYREAGTGNAGRLPMSGPADLSATPPDPAMAWQSIALPRSKPYHGGFSYEPLDVGDLTVFGTSYLTYWPTLEYSTTSKDPNATIRVVLDAGEERLGTLAPHSRKRLKVLAATYGGALLAGRFADHPKQQRVLAAGGSKRVRAFFDVPARRSMEQPGRATMYGGLWALADGSRLRLWVGGHGSVHRIPGLHDLSQPYLDRYGVYVTDGQGRVTYRQR